MRSEKVLLSTTIMQPTQEKELVKAIVKLSKYTVLIAVVAIFCLGTLIVTLLNKVQTATVRDEKIVGNSTTSVSILTALASPGASPRSIPADAWKAPDASTIQVGKTGEMIRYGRELIAHTADYFGPKGSIAQISNGMNCQNCHLAGGSKLFGNDYASFISSYPKMSGRSGKVEPVSERLAECFDRSLAGKVPDTSKKEIQAMLAYMKWIGKDVKKGQKLFGNATENLILMDNPADPIKGRVVFTMKCQSCHGNNGEGMLAADKKSYTNPPLWGKHSYNDGAGMYRITNLAGFVKNNMPFGATYERPQLTDEEAWNVAAYINSQPRPHKDQHKDWTNPGKKPIDFPYGPYADKFSEKQHKYGPFKQIKDAQKELTSKKS